VKRRPRGDLVPAELLTFEPERWARRGDAPWQVRERWRNARAAWREAHPESRALSGLEHFREEWNIRPPAPVRPPE
jgi:hypothetical protein